MAPDSATSGRLANRVDGAPMLVLPPWAMYRVCVVGSSAIPFEAWFSSDRGRPSTRSSRCQDDPFFVRRERVPELVSRFVSFRLVLSPPPPLRGSLEVT